MNKLAEEQKKLFQEDLTEDEYKQIESEFLDLYYKLRKKNENRFYSKLTLEQRKKIHKFILGIYTLKNKLGGFTHEIIKDERKVTDRPIIYAVSYAGKLFY